MAPVTLLLSCSAAAVMLAMAVWHDTRYRRIPNAVALAGALAALGLSLAPGGMGIGRASGGLAMGFAVLLPLYLMRVTGAGDVKLLAAVGAFVGYPGILGVALLSFLAGGVLSIALALRLGLLRKVLCNLRSAAFVTLADVSSGHVPDARGFPVSQARMPYAIAIAAGALAYSLIAMPGGQNVF